MQIVLMITEEEEEKLIKLVISAGTKLLEFWPGSPRVDSALGLDIKTKMDGSFVTEADYASNNILIEGLSKIFPDDGIISEELPITKEILEKNRLWIIDPLDGTKSFVNGINDFSVLVSLCQGSQPKVGIMYFPAQGKLCIAKSGQGTLVNGNKMHVSKEKTPRIKSINTRAFKLSNEEIAFTDKIDSGQAQLNVCSGVFDGVIFKLSSLREWDLAAPALAIEEAGGKVTDEKGNRIAFNKGHMPCEYYVASNGLVHEQLLKLIPKD